MSPAVQPGVRIYTRPQPTVLIQMRLVHDALEHWKEPRYPHGLPSLPRIRPDVLKCQIRLKMRL